MDDRRRVSGKEQVPGCWQAPDSHWQAVDQWQASGK